MRIRLFVCFFNLPSTESYRGLSKASVFQPVSIRIILIKPFKNQYKHRIGRDVAIVEIHSFLDPKPFRPLHHLPHVIHRQILSIAKFSEKISEKRGWRYILYRQCLDDVAV